MLPKTMKNRITALCLSTLCTLSAQANKSGSTPLNITSYNYKVIKNDTLKLDMYLPEIKGPKKPVVVYVHGGGFASGSHNADYIVSFCKAVASKGYAVAAISYRLTMKTKGFGCNVKAKHKIKAFETASEDISYAVDFILKHKDTFNIDPDKVVLSGTSSGAEAVLHMAYNFKNNILPRKFKLAGLICMTGALTTLENITAETAIPTQLFHGTGDNLVPYHISAHHFCKEDEDGYLLLYGSRVIADRLKGLGKSYYLVSSIGAPHHWSSSPMNANLNDMLDFLEHDVVKAETRQTERTIGF